MTDRTKLFSVTLADCDVQATRGTGNGGQKKNKTSSAIRITHRESGAVGYSETSRSQSENKAIAFKRMVETPTFKAWLRARVRVATGEAAEVERIVEAQLVHETLVEVEGDNGKWVAAPSLAITTSDVRELRERR